MDNNEEKYEEVNEVNETPAPEEAKAETKAPAYVPAAEKTGWGGKHVTRKFLTVALAVALALNVVLTAGVSKLLGPNRGFNKDGFGRPGNEQQFDMGRGGRKNMMPPSGNQQPDSQQDQNGQQPDDQQNESQQSEDKDSSNKNNA